MELMSALLLYALASTFQQGLGLKAQSRFEIKLNTSLMINSNYGISPKKLLLNTNGPPTESELESLFREKCKYCTDCMKLELKGNKTQAKMNRPNVLHYDVLKEHVQNIHQLKKRSVGSTTRDGPNTAKATPDTNSKVTITKYASKSGKIYALKVNETESDPAQPCRIYIVKKSLSCNYSETNLITIARTSPKKSKKSKSKKSYKSVTIPISTTTTPTVGTQPNIAQKRRSLHILDNTNVPDNFMPSIEEMY